MGHYRVLNERFRSRSRHARSAATCAVSGQRRITQRQKVTGRDGPVLYATVTGGSGRIDPAEAGGTALIVAGGRFRVTLAWHRQLPRRSGRSRRPGQPALSRTANHDDR